MTIAQSPQSTPQMQIWSCMSRNSSQLSRTQLLGRLPCKASLINLRSCLSCKKKPELCRRPHSVVMQVALQGTGRLTLPWYSLLSCRRRSGRPSALTLQSTRLPNGWTLHPSSRMPHTTQPCAGACKCFSEFKTVDKPYILPDSGHPSCFTQRLSHALVSVSLCRGKGDRNS